MNQREALGAFFRHLDGERDLPLLEELLETTKSSRGEGGLDDGTLGDTVWQALRNFAQNAARVREHGAVLGLELPPSEGTRLQALGRLMRAFVIDDPLAEKLARLISQAIDHEKEVLSGTGVTSEETLLTGPLFAPVDLSLGLEQSSGSLYTAFRKGDFDRTLHKWHHYFDVYERHFGRLWTVLPIRFLEIGVSKGGSLRLWRQYFGEKAVIVGLEKDPEALAMDGLLGCAVRIGDQADPEFLARVCEEFGPFDVVLDDGGHYAAAQIASFEWLYPRLSPRGVYVCEDTHTACWQKFRDSSKFVSFQQLGLIVADQLTKPLYADAQRFERYSIHPAEREGSIEAPLAAAITHSVTFYDSMVVFEKRPKAEPWHELR